MKCALVGLAIAAGCLVTAAAGFWLGFREAWYLGVAAEIIPRAAVATHQLQFLRSGRQAPVVAGLEFEVDNGLSWSNEVFSHPLRGWLAPLWGLEVYPAYERYVVQLADYRKLNPSPLRPEDFEKNKELAQGARDARERIDRMVERYSTKR